MSTASSWARPWRFLAGLARPLGEVDRLDAPRHINRTARRIARRLYDDPAIWSSKERVTALIAVGIREHIDELEEQFPIDALVIFFAALAAGLVLGSVCAVLFGWRI